MWLFEQTQAIEAFDVFTPVRMTVIKLKSGGLWVHAPLAPTQVRGIYTLQLARSDINGIDIRVMT